jgi:hypothetical protein
LRLRLSGKHQSYEEQKKVSKTTLKTARRVKKPATLTRLKRNPQKRIVKKRIRRVQPLHKRFLLHPFSLFILLCTSVFVIGWSYEAIADSYTVDAVVPAALLTQGAVITSPADGTTVATASLNVIGTCPYGSYVKLYTNNTFSGVVFCASDGSFQLSDDLFLGENNLTAQDFNVTDQAGPATAGVTVTYTPPSPPVQPPTTTSPSTSGTSTANGSSSPPLLLTSEYHYQTYPINTAYTWSIDLQGGTPPYNVYIQWGDGTSSTLVFKTDPVFTISHVYKKVGYYAIKVETIDSHGAVRYIQLAALVVGTSGATNPAPTTGSTSPTTHTPAPTTSIAKKVNGLESFFARTKVWLWIAWPSLIIVIVMLVSFWLGERREIELLYKKKRARYKARKT